MGDARQSAFEILLKIHRKNAYSNLALDAALKDEKTDRAESALISALVYTTLERLITIDYELSLYLKQPIKKL
ncbi:MAG: 16S rRNA (cytosine(967)-C(5))-methyltransferase RsmB, partial [Clostridiales bacterium]|nr:16S rRNA (cytosine(967)-C(5))-methyltransferase RsmB [Clostridiales bacterium]